MLDAKEFNLLGQGVISLGGRGPFALVKLHELEVILETPVVDFLIKNIPVDLFDGLKLEFDFIF